MIQNSFIDMESMFKLFQEEEEVLLKLAHVWSVFSLYYDPLCYIFHICSLVQVKDEVNAGSFLYKLGKVEFENVYFSYTNGLVHIYFKAWFELKLRKVVN